MTNEQGGLDIRVDGEGAVLEAERRDVPFDDLPNEEKLRLAAGRALTGAMDLLGRVVGMGSWRPEYGRFRVIEWTVEGP